MFRAWHQQPHLRPHPWKYGLSAPPLHNISLRGEAAFFSSTIQQRKKLRAFSWCQGWGHQSVCANFTSQPGCLSHTHTHTHTEQLCLLYRSSLTLGACGYIVDLVKLDDTWRWYFCLEGSVNEDVKVCWSFLSNVYFSTAAWSRCTTQTSRCSRSCGTETEPSGNDVLSLF